MIDLPTPPDRPITWQASRGRFVVLVQAQSWFGAREAARALLGAEPLAVVAGYHNAPPKALLF